MTYVVARFPVVCYVFTEWLTPAPWEKPMPIAVDHLTIEGFASLAGISRATFYNWQRRNQAPATFRLGGRRYVSRAVAEAWLRSAQEAA